MPRAPVLALCSEDRKRGSSRRHGPVVVIMIAMRVLKAAADQVVNVVAVRHSLVAAGWAVLMRRFALIRRRTSRGISVARLDDMLVDMTFVRMVQVPVMQVVDMVAVANGGMPTPWAVLMPVISVFRLSAACHG